MTLNLRRTALVHHAGNIAGALDVQNQMASVSIETQSRPGICEMIAEKLASGQIDISYVMVQPAGETIRAYYGFPSEEEAERAMVLFEEIEIMLGGRATLRVIGGTTGALEDAATAA